MGTITVLGNDPGFANWGFALVDVDTETLEFQPRYIALKTTAKSKNKQVRASSDKLVRARFMHEAFTDFQKKVHVCAAEIPSGAQSANAAMAFGIVIGVVSTHQKPLIEVSPAEAKKAATGYSTASKEEMIEWATEAWPKLEWTKGRGSKKWADSNEHMADALAIALTATKTETFKAAAAMMGNSLFSVKAG